MRIVVVDDDPLFLRLMQKAFEAAQPDAVVLSAPGLARGREVATQLQSLHTLPDLFLIDSSLGDGSGLQMLQFLKSDPLFAEIPAVLVTAHLDDEDERAATAAGAVVCFQKPAGFDKLVDLASRLLALVTGV